VFDNVLIYRFWPHGSKKIDDLLPIKKSDWVEFTTSLQVYCNDQEPLHWELYQSTTRVDNSKWPALLRKNSVEPFVNNFCIGQTFYDKNILLHSEQRSSQCEQYQKNNFVPAYYWSHAIIARDWFRFAQHVKQKKSIKKMFLIYNRAWSGTREYRLKFIDLLIDRELVTYCKTSVNAIEPELGVHYNFYQFNNLAWKPINSLENCLTETLAPATASADFDLDDYEHTNIEVILETLFDDDRLHLTEKTLRPIACGQPFILSATVGSLKYLQQYGFKTFDNIWNEEYDSIQDPQARLNAIVELMHEIANWDPTTFQLKLTQAREIAEYNKQYFFSQDFFALVDGELRQNLSNALVNVEKTNTAQMWSDRWRKLSTVDEFKKIISGSIPHPDFDSNPTFFSSYTKENIAKIIAMSKKLQDQKNSS
jgi:hypothetical protein